MAIVQNIKLAADAIVFAREGDTTSVLLVQRKNDPYKGTWAIPGGFIEDAEDLQPAAIRELEEETGLKLQQMTQLYAIGTPGRDPRFRTVSIVYYAVLDHKPAVTGADDAADARWFDIADLPALAFDHDEVIRYAISRAL